MIVELNIPNPQFEVGETVQLNHPLIAQGTVGMITQALCVIRSFTVQSPPKLTATKAEWGYFLSTDASTAYAEDDLSLVSANNEGAS